MSAPTPILIAKQDIRLLGIRVQTVDELLSLLAQKEISLVTLQFDVGSDYETVGKVIYSLARYGIEIDKSGPGLNV